jgi:hypothetical protein
MPPTSPVSEPRPLAQRPPQRPWRRVEPRPRRPERVAEHRFVAPVVRELPARRELRSVAADW